MTVTDSTVEDGDPHRAAYISGLRALAAVLDENPQVPLPSTGRLEPVTIAFLAGDDIPGRITAASQAIGCPSWDTATRDYTSTGGHAYADLNGTLNGLLVRLTAYRDGPPDEAAEDARLAARRPARSRRPSKRAAAPAGAA
jgi:hypothetical protein